jgi:hypothetical protein
MALLATIHIVFIQMLMEDRNIVRDEATWEALRWFSYSGLIVNATGSASAVLLVSMESTLTDRARDEIRAGGDSLPAMMHREGLRRRDIEAQGNQSRDARLLTQFGFNIPRIILFYHFYLAFLLGIFFFLVTIGLWIWCNERKILAALLIPVLITGLTPICIRLYVHNLV